LNQTIGWPEIFLRLGLTFLAGALIGLDRRSSDRPAGLRTTILVCLAAAVAMIQVDLLLPLSGKSSDSYVVLDLMRLPLGILSGVGFIGAGTIIHRESRAVGVTTAATLWIGTVIGLCFGGGQIGLGLVATALALLVLVLLRRVERRLSQVHHAVLTAELEPDTDAHAELRRLAATQGTRIEPVSLSWHHGRQCCEASWVLRWRSAEGPSPPAFLGELGRVRGVSSLRWRLTGQSRN